MNEAEFLARIDATLNCMRIELEAMRNMLEYQNGRALETVRGHNPQRLPVLYRGAAQASMFDYKAGLGKTVTYARINNLGATQAKIAFTSEAAQNTSITVTIAPGDIFEPKFHFDKAQVLEDGEGAVLVEVLAQ